MVKKIVYILVLVCCFAVCGSGSYALSAKAPAPVPDTYEWYKVIEIRSVKGYYEIYALKRNEPYKIISAKDAPKVKGKKKTKIKVGEWYPFELKSRRELHPAFDVTNYQEVTFMHGKTPIKIDGGSQDLYYGDNIAGLHFISEKVRRRK